MRLLWRYLTLISFDACTSVSFRSVTPAITVIRSRSFRLMVNVSMLWPGCYRVPAHGDILIELPRGHSHGVPTARFFQFWFADLPKKLLMGGKDRFEQIASVEISRRTRRRRSDDFDPDRAMIRAFHAGLNEGAFEPRAE